ncbi:hypothetical protein GCM10011297_10360 [Bacterioplanes sanyensis]|uniref:PD-(D/E)XK nuclease family protein n=1 Tax=Bacterioplanes sanyensis TaxID=1249553 RepID=UPI00167BEC66|nr:PD-(D/E)XK nuclease family protein [Bacterioplanes sanyensis]GGY39086.1 hypothetical protein GCM10011297_10360 [Bacterioplanes sanyensis]
MAKLPTEYKNAMQSALEELNEVLLERQGSADDDIRQETNIFRILRIENYEIRHGAFLDYLLDPDRNPELAHEFAKAWIAEIYDELSIDDGGFLERLFEANEFELGPLKDEHRFSEVSIPESRLRIDHAFEVKVGKTRRVFVFEYKHNGVVQNDLAAYQAFVNDKYAGNRYLARYFVMDLGNKIHNSFESEIFDLVSKETLVNALDMTLDLAVRKDMQATRMYLEQYRDILAPEVEEQYPWRGLENILWNTWNPSYIEYDDAWKVWDKLAEKAIDDPDIFEDLAAFDTEQLFDQAVLEALEDVDNCSVRRNSGWVRIEPSKCQLKHFYLFSNLWFGPEGLYMGLNLQSWHDPKGQVEEQEKQHQLALQVLANSRWGSFCGSPEQWPSLSRIELTFSRDESSEFIVKDLKLRNRSESSKRTHGVVINIKLPIELSELKQACCSDEMPKVFTQYIAEAEALVESINKLS